MVSASPVAADPLEAVLARCRPSAEDIFRRFALSPEEAQTLLVAALARIDSLEGAVPGAGHRLLKLLEADCRRARPQESPREAWPAVDYRQAFEAATEHLRRRRRESESHRAEALEAVADIEVCCARLGPRVDGALSHLRRSRELFVAVLERARSLWKADPRRSLVLAEAALDLLREAPAGVLHDRLRWDLEARAHAFAGNAHRILDDYRSADREFVAAQAALVRGSQDPRERALLLTLVATLRRVQAQYRDSLRDFQQAAAIYRWARDRHLEGRTYSMMAITHAYAGQPDLAIPLAERAAELIDVERDPQLAATIEQNMTHFLCAGGRPQEARARLARARRLAQAAGTDPRGLRWVEGQIAFALGEREEGERLLLGVRQEFIAAGSLYDTALVSLELAAEYLDQGRTTDAKRLAEETLPIFQSLEVHREALAALIAVQRAIELETATAELVRELLATLQRARNGPPPRPEQPS